MDKKSRKQISDYYSKRLHKYGPTVKSLAYKAVGEQNKRFALLADVGPICRNSSVLDVGCGLGHFCEFLRKYGWEGKYTGIDFDPNMVAAAKKRLPNDNFICKDILVEEFNEKHDYVFCGATIQHKPQYSDPDEYLKQMVRKMFSLAKKALVFDIFSSRVDYMDENKLYIDPTSLLNFCYTLTNRVVLRNDARPYEIMMYLYKDVSKDRFNIYRGWTPPTPKVI